MSLPIAREGRGIVLGGLALTTTLFAIGGRAVRNIALATLAATGALAFFFRDPERFVVPIDNGILAPADGKVIRIDETEAPEFFEGPVRCVSIFMSLTDCHVNRAPVGGKVSYQSTADGGFLAAWDDRASDENRRAYLGIMGEPPALTKQVAGFAARQIVQYPRVGDFVEQGDRIGIIMLGSRVDVYFPLDLRLMVNVGDATIGGVTALAERIS
ncbi:MAG: phosphatidylserine decarboxylase [Candidatus Hydrogenedentota bacterium]